MIICEGKELPETYQGFKTADLLKTWDEIKGDGTKAPKNQIKAMRFLLKEFRLGIFGAFDRAKAAETEPDQNLT